MIRRILVADDSQYMRMKMRKILVNAGYMVAGEVENGFEAVQAYKQLQPNLLILNMVMPQMTGIEALAEIKAWDPNAKVLFCSALGQTDLMFRALRLGANNIVIKPFQDTMFLDAVERLVRDMPMIELESEQGS